MLQGILSQLGLKKLNAAEFRRETDVKITAKHVNF